MRKNPLGKGMGKSDAKFSFLLKRFFERLNNSKITLGCVPEMVNYKEI